MPSALASARAIVRVIRAARREGQTINAIILSPKLHETLQDQALSYLWTSPSLDELFGVPVEVDPYADGWAIRVR